MNTYRSVKLYLRRLLLISLFCPFAIPAMTAAGNAESCYRQIDAGLDNLQKQLPAITSSAEKAATACVKNDFAIVVFGDPGLVSEAVGRAGGLMAIKRGNLKTDDSSKTVALFFPYPPVQEEELAAAVKMQKSGGIIVIFGDALLKTAAIKAGITADNFIDTGCPAETLKFPSDSVMNMAALWCWTGEFVAACTRLNRMPTLYQSFSVPGARERAAKLRGLKFHSETPQPVAAGVLGIQYLAGLKQSLIMLHKKELDHIRAAAAQAVSATKSGHLVYLSVNGHAPVGHLPRIKEELRMPTLNKKWKPFSGDTKLDKGDFVLFIGYDDTVPALAEAVQKANAGMAWSLTDYKIASAGSATIPPEQIFINQRWTLGDAITTVPGYDIRILPPSGVIAETILGMILAEMDSIEHSGDSPK